MKEEKKKTNSCTVSKLKKGKLNYPRVPYGYGWKEFPLTDEWRLFIDTKGIADGFPKVKVTSVKPRHGKANFNLAWHIMENRFVNCNGCLAFKSGLPEVAALTKAILMEQIHGETDA